MYGGQHPGQIIDITGLNQDRSDTPVIPALLQDVLKFPFDPHRFHSVRAEQQNKPVTPFEGGADFILPLLGADDIGGRIPDRNPMRPQHTGYFFRLRRIL